MPLIGRPMLSTIVSQLVRRDDRRIAASISSTERGLLDPGAGLGADVQLDLRAIDRRKEVLAEERHERERGRATASQEAGDEQTPRQPERS